MLPDMLDVLDEIEHKRNAGLPLWPLSKMGGFQPIMHQHHTGVLTAPEDVLMRACGPGGGYRRGRFVA